MQSSSSSRIMVPKLMNGLLRTIEQRQFLDQRSLLGLNGSKNSFANKSGRTADPADHSIEPEEVQTTDAIRDTKERHRSDSYEPTTKDNEPYVPPDPPIVRSAPKIRSSGVGPRTDNPLSQQSRRE